MKMQGIEARVKGFKKVNEVPKSGETHETRQLSILTLESREYTLNSWPMKDYGKFIRDNKDMLKSVTIEPSYEGMLVINIDGLEFNAFPRSHKIDKRMVSGSEMWVMTTIVEIDMEFGVNKGRSEQIEGTLIEMVGEKKMDENGKRVFAWHTMDTANIYGKSKDEQ